MNVRLITLAAASCALCMSASASEDFPKLRSGLWDTTSGEAGKPLTTMQLCIDDQTYSLMFKTGQSARQKSCSEHHLQNLGGGKYVEDSVCTFGNSRVTSHGVMTVTGDTAYHVERKAHWVPPLMGRTNDAVTTMDSRWLGPCGAGMRAGDMIMKPTPSMPNGMRMNILDTNKAQ